MISELDDLPSTSKLINILVAVAVAVSYNITSSLNVLFHCTAFVFQTLEWRMMAAVSRTQGPATP